MPIEHLLASYIVRVLVRAGVRSITLHNVRTSETQTFKTYREVLEYLGRSEESTPWQGSASPVVDKPP